MTIDGRPKIVSDTEQTPKLGSLPLGQSKKDADLAMCMVKDIAEQSLPCVEYIPVDRGTSGPAATPLDPPPIGGRIPLAFGPNERGYDALYNEQKYPVFLPPVQVRASIVMEPPLKLLRRYGIETEHSIMAKMATAELNELGLNPVTGDRIMYLGVTYEIIRTVYMPEDYYLQTQVPLYKSLFLKQVAIR